MKLCVNWEKILLFHTATLKIQIFSICLKNKISWVSYQWNKASRLVIYDLNKLDVHFLHYVSGYQVTTFMCTTGHTWQCPHHHFSTRYYCHPRKKGITPTHLNMVSSVSHPSVISHLPIPLLNYVLLFWTLWYQYRIHLGNLTYYYYHTLPSFLSACPSVVSHTLPEYMHTCTHTCGRVYVCMCMHACKYY